MGLEEDLSAGEQLIAVFRPFLEHLAASDLSPKTIQKHVDNVWALGGEFVRDLHNDPSLRKKLVELVLRRMIEYGGPLLYHGGEDQQKYAAAHDFKSLQRFPGFVYHKAGFSSDYRSIEIAVGARKGSKAVCSRCHQPAPGYDQSTERRFEFIPFWGFLVFLLYSMRRVDCRRCRAVLVEEVPSGDWKRTLTKAYMLFLARWARRLSWKETAERSAPHGKRSLTPSNTSLPSGWSIARSAASMPLESTRSSTPEATSSDAGLSDRSRHDAPALDRPRKDDPVVPGILQSHRRRTRIEDRVRLFGHVGTLSKGGSWDMLGRHSRPFPHSGENGKALDEVRAIESRRLAREGFLPVLKKSRWLLLKREENLQTEQRFRLRDLLRYNLKTVRAYILKEAFQQLWDYNSPAWAGKFPDAWCRQVMRSRIDPMKKIARSLRQHRELILNYFWAQKLLSSGGVEG